MGCGGGVALGVARGVALRGGARRGVVRRGRGAEGSKGPREDRRPARAYEQQAASSVLDASLRTDTASRGRKSTPPKQNRLGFHPGATHL